MNFISWILISIATLSVITLNIRWFKLSIFRRCGIVLILLLCMGVLSVYSINLEKNKWVETSFSGSIMKIEETREHSLKEYTIENKSDRITILDNYFKLYNCKVGDNVIKESGESHVVVKRP